jgi:tetratricopeptide (TPR) repeat protein
VLPYDAALEIARKHTDGDDTDLEAAVGAFIIVPLSLQNDGSIAIMVVDDFRQERLFEASFRPGQEDDVADRVAAAIVARRTQPSAEAHLSRRAMAALLRAIRLVLYPGEGSNTAAIAALKDVIEEAPDSAVAHAWLANAYHDHGGEAFWIDSSIDEAARAQRMDPTLGLATARLAAAYVAKGWYARAMAAYEQAQSQDALFLEEPLGWIYYQRGRFRDAYGQAVERARFGTDVQFPQILAAQILLAAGATDAGERALRRAMAAETSAAARALHDAEIAWFRGDVARCLTLAGALEPARSDGFFSGAGLVRSCAIEQGDFAAALATMPATEQAYASDHAASNADHPALRKAILLAKVGRGREIAQLVRTARQGLQAAIDASSDVPSVWLRMAAAQHLDGEVETAYATLEHAFALGLTVNRRNRNDPEFLPFRGEARFEALRAKSEAAVGAERQRLEEALKAGEPNLIFRPPAPAP